MNIEISLNVITNTEIVSVEQNIKCFHAYWRDFHVVSMKSEEDAAKKLGEQIRKSYA